MSNKFAVYLEPYSLDPSEVGRDIYQPILISRHRSKLAAARRLMRQITEIDKEAREYLAQVNGNPYSIALRYLIWEIAPSGRIVQKFSVKGARNGQ
jgi:hypothetical protein